VILLTRLGGPVFALNPDLVERADCTPDTVITLVDGKKYVVAESLPEVIALIRQFRATVVADAQYLSHQPTGTGHHGGRNGSPGGPTHGGPTHGGSTHGGSAHGGSAHGGSSHGGSSHGGSSHGGSSHGAHGRAGQVHGGQAHGGRNEHGHGERTATDRAAGERGTDDRGSADGPGSNVVPLHPRER
jgi:flagellar protein FlbD